VAMLGVLVLDKSDQVTAQRPAVFQKIEALGQGFGEIQILAAQMVLAKFRLKVNLAVGAENAVFGGLIGGREFQGEGALGWIGIQAQGRPLVEVFNRTAIQRNPPTGAIGPCQKVFEILVDTGVGAAQIDGRVVGSAVKNPQHGLEQGIPCQALGQVLCHGHNARAVVSEGKLPKRGAQGRQRGDLQGAYAMNFEIQSR